MFAPFFKGTCSAQTPTQSHSLTHHCQRYFPSLQPGEAFFSCSVFLDLGLRTGNIWTFVEVFLALFYYFWIVNSWLAFSLTNQHQCLLYKECKFTSPSVFLRNQCWAIYSPALRFFYWHSMMHFYLPFNLTTQFLRYMPAHCALALFSLSLPS